MTTPAVTPSTPVRRSAAGRAERPRRPGLVQARRLLRGAGPRLRRLQRRRHRRPARPAATSSTTCSGSASTACGCRRSTPRRCATAATTSATTPACCPSSARSTTSSDFLDAAHERGIRVIVDFVMNHTSDQHPWFQASRSDPDGPYGDFYVWNDDDTPLPRGADHLRRHRAVELDVRPGPQAVLLAPLLQPPARPELRLPRRAAGDPRGAALLARPRHRRLPPRRRALPLRPRRHERREPARDARVPQAGAQGGRPRLPRPRAAVRGQPVARRRRRVLRRPVRRRRRVPHGVPLPGHAAHLHGRAPRDRATRSRRSWSRRRRSPTTASGASSCATTTS